MKKIIIALGTFLAATAAFGQDAQWTPEQATAIKGGMYFLAVAIAAFGGTRGQGAAASAALNGMARNPAAADKLMTPMILGLALMESLVIFTLISPFVFR
ncbi:MAG: ATP synthase F0 subunit C [Halobacteriovoraceae bacterium]|jgi:F-type H+-transporting ATPase subunit c|nr:ATP synthase F0 subunit C [Halobacteriovoraceae bacterium]MBT5093132.1 ATP synthase F0 subunit C [Halobacteriovoraceae bacterium]